MKIVQFSRPPNPLSIYVRNFSCPCTLNVQSQWYHTCELTKSKQNQNQVTSHSNWPRVLLFDLAHKQCNGIIKRWFYCLTSEFKVRFLPTIHCLAQHDVATIHPPPPPPPSSDNISFLPDPLPPQSGRHICITPTVQIFLPTILLKVTYSTK